MGPIRCVMLISAAGRVRKPESPEATPAVAMFMDFRRSSNCSKEAFISEKKTLQLSLHGALDNELLLFLCFGWMWRGVVIAPHDVVKILFLVRSQKSPDFGMKGALA